MARRFFVYIMTNSHHTVLYTGVTSDLPRRIWEHRQGAGSGFTARYNARKLVYFEAAPDARAAILREKQIKAGRRARKVELIESMNREWRDLAEDCGLL